MLMPGWIPCIPGWHCDGVIRRRQGSQPDLKTIGEDVKHLICSISTSDRLCPTEYIDRPLLLDVDETAVWGSVNARVGEYEHSRWLDSGQILLFNRPTLHRGTPAKERGWRYFFRLSFYHMPAVNQVRHQVQVYPTDQRGW